MTSKETGKDRGNSVTRRGFLRSSALIGGAAAAAPLLWQASGGAAAPARGAAGRKQGYRETAHVREYYDKARF